MVKERGEPQEMSCLLREVVGTQMIQTMILIHRYFVEKFF